MPTYSFSISESYLYKNSVWGNPITLELLDWEEKYKKTAVFLNNLNTKNMSLVSTIPLFCDTKQEMKCYASTEKDLYYSDSNHLTLKGAHIITNAIELMINRK